MNSLELIASILVVIIYAFFMGSIIAYSFVEIFIRIRSIKDPKYKLILTENRTHEKELRKMRYDYYHDLKLMKDIHAEKIAEIVRGEVNNDESPKHII